MKCSPGVVAAHIRLKKKNVQGLFAWKHIFYTQETASLHSTSLQMLPMPVYVHVQPTACTCNVGMHMYTYVGSQLASKCVQYKLVYICTYYTCTSIQDVYKQITWIHVLVARPRHMDIYMYMKQHTNMQHAGPTQCRNSKELTIRGLKMVGWLSRNLLWLKRSQGSPGGCTSVASRDNGMN